MGIEHEASPADQVVSNGFASLLTAMEARADDLRVCAAEALLERDDSRAQAYLVSARRVVDIASELEGLLRRWREAWPVGTQETEVHVPREASNGSKFRVRLNGEVIEHATAAETFARTIEKIGIERVARMDRKLSGIPLVGVSKADGYQQQLAIGGFYVCTHSNNQTKKRILEDLATELGIALAVEING